MWITCGLLWCFYQLFGLSFWRHPFTAENLLVSNWCNAKIFQICFNEDTHSSSSWMAWGWVYFHRIFIFGWTISLKTLRKIFKNVWIRFWALPCCCCVWWLWQTRGTSRSCLEVSLWVWGSWCFSLVSLWGATAAMPSILHEIWGRESSHWWQVGAWRFSGE